MKYIRTLNQVQYTEQTLYGARGCDLARLLADRVPIPPTFILTTDAWNHFIQKNNIKYKIDFILKQVNLRNEKTLINAFNSIRKLILAHPIPEDIVIELREAYESLGQGVALDEMMKSDNAPFVSMVSSPDYPAEAESFEGMIQNIQGMEEVLLALKELYAMAYTPEALMYRAKLGTKKFSYATIIQSMPGARASATAYSTDPESQDMIFVHAYRGYADLRDLIAKDFFHVKKEFLNVAASQIVEQSKIIVREEDGQLYPIEFREGRGQSLNDKEIMEIARLAKKTEKVLETPAKIFFSITAKDFFVLFANRYAVPKRAMPKAVLVSEELAQATVAAAAQTTKPQEPTEKVAQVRADTKPENLSLARQDEPVEIEEEMTAGAHEEPETEDVQPEIVAQADTQPPSQARVDVEQEKDTNAVLDTDEDFLELVADEKEEDSEHEGEDLRAEGGDETSGYEDENLQIYEESDEDDSEEDLEDDDEEYDDSEDESDEEYDEELDEDDSEYEDDDELEDEDSEGEYDSDEEYEDSDEDNLEDDEDSEDEEYDDDSDEEADEDDTEYEDSDDEYDDEEDDDDEEYESSQEDEDQDEIDDSEDTIEEQDDSEESNQDTSNDSPQALDEHTKEVMNSSFRMIYTELSKRYEKSGDQAPDTITELISLGTQKGLFSVEGLHEALEIKRKVRRNEPISEAEKNLVLDIVNSLVE